LFGWFESQRHLFGTPEPGRIHLLGTDDLGRDQFTGFLYGGQASLFLGCLATGISLVLGLVTGIGGGYHRSWADNVVTGAVELSLAVPWLYLVFAARALLPVNAAPSAALLLLVSTLGILGWPQTARLIRGAVLTTAERGCVLVSKGFGGSDFHLFRMHLLPQLAPVVMTQAFLLMPRYVLAEVILSFLGLGVNAPAATWGGMLAQLQRSGLTSHWWLLLPGLLLVPTFLSYFTIWNVVRRRASVVAQRADVRTMNPLAALDGGSREIIPLIAVGLIGGRR
jgi:peptide/nickel transport system permease protein